MHVRKKRVLDTARTPESASPDYIRIRMNIPQKYQVFDTPVELSDKDSQRLSPYLTGWNKLNQLFTAGINEPDLKRLVILEMMGAKRESIIERVLMRLGRVQRERLQAKIESAVRLVPTLPYSERRKTRQ